MADATIKNCVESESKIKMSGLLQKWVRFAYFAMNNEHKRFLLTCREHTHTKLTLLIYTMMQKK